jgi:membrane-associated HD superfamily phosphohydrolase
LREGEIYDGEQIIAPFTFSIDKTPEEYNRDVRLARESVYPVFVRDDSTEAQGLRALDSFLASVEQNIEALVPDSMKMRRLRDVFATQPKLVISDEGLSFLVRSFTRGERPASANGRFAAYAAQLKRICRDLFAVGILSVERSALLDHARKISVRHRAEEIVEAIDQFHDVESVNTAALQKLRKVENLGEPAINLGYQILTNFLRPNLFSDERETQLRLNEAEAKVPRARGTVLAKERIIDSHDKITPEHLQKLRSLTTEMARRSASEGGITRLLPVAGRIFILLIAAGILGVFLLQSRPAIYQDAHRLLLIASIPLLVTFVCFLINVVGLSEYLIPVAMASMLLTFFFDAQLAFVGTVALGIVLGGIRGYEFSAIFTTLIAGSFSILAVRRVRSRSWIFKAILYLALAYLVIISTTAFLRHTPFKQTLLNLGDGMINALLCPILTYGVMVILEYLFDLTTDATLLELSALNRRCCGAGDSSAGHLSSQHRRRHLVRSRGRGDRRQFFAGARRRVLSRHRQDGDGGIFCGKSARRQKSTREADAEHELAGDHQSRQARRGNRGSERHSQRGARFHSATSRHQFDFLFL